MKNTLSILIANILMAITLSSCYVSSDVASSGSYSYYENQVYTRTTVYPYYYFPDMNVYYSPDMSVYWWNNGGSWFSGAQLPGYYNISYNTTYVIVNSKNTTPYKNNRTYATQYKNGYYSNSTYTVGNRPLHSFNNDSRVDYNQNARQQPPAARSNVNPPNNTPPADAQSRPQISVPSRESVTPLNRTNQQNDQQQRQQQQQQNATPSRSQVSPSARPQQTPAANARTTSVSAPQTS